MICHDMPLPKKSRRAKFSKVLSMPVFTEI